MGSNAMPFEFDRNHLLQHSAGDGETAGLCAMGSVLAELWQSIPWSQEEAPSAGTFPNGMPQPCEMLTVS